MTINIHRFTEENTKQNPVRHIFALPNICGSTNILANILVFAE